MRRHSLIVIGLLTVSCAKGSDEKSTDKAKTGPFHCYSFTHDGEDRSYCRASKAECEQNRGETGKIATVTTECAPSTEMWCFGNDSFSECTRVEQECQKARKNRARGLREPISSYSECESSPSS